MLFRDSWDREVRSVLRSNIGKIEINRPITVMMYGLSNKNYGTNKCTIPTALSCIVNSKPIWNQDKSILQVGVSFNRRHVNSLISESFTKSFSNSLTIAIQKLLQEV